MTNKKGISLIVLIITIIVIIILAGAVILSLNNTNVIDNSNTAVNKQNQVSLQSQVTLLLQDVMFDVMEPISVEPAAKNKLEGALLYVEVGSSKYYIKKGASGYEKIATPNDKTDAYELVDSVNGPIKSVPAINDTVAKVWKINTDAQVYYEAE